MNKMSEKYNGWANYPTWCVMLWLDNDPGLYDESRRIALEDYELGIYRDDAIKQFVEDLIFEIGQSSIVGASMEADLLGWALAMVDWREISDALLEE